MTESELAVNFSFVLHERSDSNPSRRAASAARKPLPHLKQHSPIVHDGDIALQVDAWLIPAVGYPDDVRTAVCGAAEVFAIDAGIEPQQEVTFFRAPARLALPQTGDCQLGVAALIRRPGGRSRQIIVRGPFTWPTQQTQALRAIEAIIQAHAEQWRPREQLWAAPAEVLLFSDFDQRFNADGANRPRS